MVRKYFDRIEKDTDVRQNLIDLRRELKTDRGMDDFRKNSDEYIHVLTGLLAHEDPKVRRNAALILGETGTQQALTDLNTAYLREQQLFVRSAYLTAMGYLDYRPLLKEFRGRIGEIMASPMTTENRKHLSEELRLLRDMVMLLETPVKHRFTGYSRKSDMILLTSPGFEALTFDDLPESLRRTGRIMNGGVRVVTDELEPVLNSRTVKDILFRFCKNPLPDNDYQAVAKVIVESGLTDYLRERHEGEAPFYFRIDLRTCLVLNEKSQYIKRLAAELEQQSEYQLVNSASNFECELRVTENKKGQYNVYLLLRTLPDERFAYRRHSLPTSMHPVRAAEIAALADEYIQDNAVVLDPFCGTGTLLIERYRRRRTANLYGVDIYGEAIDMARENAGLAHVPAYFVNKDFAEFTHKYQFDEIITEMPSQTEKMTAELLYRLYRSFIGRLPEWMKDGGYVIVCTTEEKWLRDLAKQSGHLKEEAVYHLSGRRETALVILRYHE